MNFPLPEPELVGLDIDSPERLSVHRRVHQRKAMIRQVFEEMHRICRKLDEKYFGTTAGLRIELGAGVAPIRDSFGDVLATDVVPSAHLDRTLDAMDLDLESQSVRVFYLQNAFHHLPAPEKFFDEALRVVRPGGGLILIEPYYSVLSKVIYPRLFRSEGYDCEMPGWECDSSGPMNGANQALSYIVFNRDRNYFEARFPGLSIEYVEPLTNWLRYLASGGLNFRPLLPDAAIGLLKLAETVLTPAKTALALHHVIVLKRRDA